MAEADWTLLTDGPAIGVIDRGVTTGVTPPSGGGSFVYGFNTLSVVSGAVGLFVNGVNFAPAAKGLTIRGAIKRLPSGGPTSFAPFFFVGLQGTSVNNAGYLLGLGDADPYHIILKKGTVVGGLADATPNPTVNGILRQSTATYSQDTWHHLRLDMIVNLNGDVLLQCFENDLAVNPLGSAPSWTAIPGMDSFVDDVLQINTGSAPYTSGRGGYAFQASDVTRRAAVDHIELYRQL